MDLPTLTSPSVQSFMAKISKELQTTLPPPSQILSFGSTLPHPIPKMNRLVLLGVKRAMAGFPAPLNLDSGDLIIAVNSELPEILVRVLYRKAVLFSDVTEKFVFEEGHPEFGVDYWKSWHLAFWEKSLDCDGSVFGDGNGKKVSNLGFEVLWPVPQGVGPGCESVKALLELVERVQGLKVGSEGGE